MMVETKRESSDPYYDLEEDFDLILSSFQTQYGIRLSRELKDMRWDEFRSLLAGLDGDTPLGRVVSIRSEDDPDVLKSFTRGQQKIRNDWRKQSAKEIPQEKVDEFVEQMKNIFISMAGGGDDN